MFSTWFFKNIARLVLFSYSLQIVTPAYGGFIDTPEELSNFRSGLKAKVKAVDPFGEMASKKSMPTLTIQTTQTGNPGQWDLTVSQTHFDKNTSLFTTDYAWKETYSPSSPSPLIRHPWEQFLKLQFSDGELIAQTIPQTDQLNPYYPAYNYVFNTTASTNLTLHNLVTSGFVDVQDAAIVTTKHLEAHSGIRLKSQQEIRNTATDGEDTSRILSKGQIFLKTPYLDTQKGHIEGEEILGFLGGKKDNSKDAISLNISDGAIMANQTQIFNRGEFFNHKGIMGGRDLLDFYGEGKIHNQGGQLWSRGNTSLQADALDNKEGAEVSGKNLNIRVEQQLDTDKTSHLIAKEKMKLRADTVHQDSPFFAKTLDVYTMRDLILGDPQCVENLFLSMENVGLVYQPDGLQASHLLSITSKAPLTLTIPVKTPGAFQATAPEIINKTSLIAKDELTLTGSSTAIPFPVRNTGDLVSNTKGITIKARGFSHEVGIVDMAGDFGFKGENLKLLGQTIIGGDVHLKDRGKGEVDYSKLSVAGLLHITLPENQTTLPHAFKTPGQLLLDRAGNSTQPLHILNDLLALKGIEIHLPNAELIFGAELDTQPMVKIQAKEGAVKTNSRSLDIIKAQLYSKTGMEFEVQKKQIHIGRGVVKNTQQTFNYKWENEPPVANRVQAANFIVGLDQRKQVNENMRRDLRLNRILGSSEFQYLRMAPFKESNETFIITDGPARMISPQGILIDQAELHVKGAEGWDVTTEDPVRSEGGKIFVQGKTHIHDSECRITTNASLQNVLLTQVSPWTKWNGIRYGDFIHPLARRGEISFMGDLKVARLENMGGYVYIAGDYSGVDIKETNFIPESYGTHPYIVNWPCFQNTWSVLGSLIQEKFPSIISAKQMKLHPKDLNLEGILQTQRLMILVDGKLQVGKIANYRRPPTPKFESLVRFTDGIGLSPIFEDDLNSPTPWIRNPQFNFDCRMTLPPTVVCAKGGFRLQDSGEKYLFHWQEEINNVVRILFRQLYRGCVNWKTTDPREMYYLARLNSYEFYQKVSALFALNNGPQNVNESHATALTAANPSQTLSTLISRLSVEEQAKFMHMIFYEKTSYETASHRSKEVLAPVSYVSPTCDNPLARNPDGGIIADWVTLKRTSDASEVQNFATIFGKHLVDIDVGTVENNRTSHTGVTYHVNSTHRKGGWFSSDKDTYEIVAVPFSHTQSNTGIIATGPEGELNLTAEKFSNLNGAEVISGSGGQHLAIGTLNSTPAINTYPVSFQVEAKGYRATVHGVGAQIIPAAITSTGGIEWDVDHLNLTGTRVIEEAKDIDMVVGVGHLLPALQTVLANVTAEGNSKTTTVQTTYAQMASPTVIAALQGDVRLSVRKFMDGVAPVIFGNHLNFNGKFNLPGMFLHNTVHTDSQTRSTFSSSHTVAHQDILVQHPTVIEGRKSITFEGEANLPGTHLKAPVIYDNTDDGLTMGPVIECAHQRQETHYSSPLAYGNAGSAGWREEQVAPRIDAEKLIHTNTHGMMRFTNAELNVEDIQGHFETFVHHLLSHHEEWSHHTQLISEEFKIVVALALSYCTGGAASGLGAALCGSGTMSAGMVAAAFKAVWIQAATNFAGHGDPLRTAGYLVSKEGTRTILSSTVKESLVGSGGYDASQGLGLNLTLNAGRAVVGVGVDGTVGGQKVNGDTFKKAVLQAGLETGTGYVAHNIGAMPQQSQENQLLNHGMHVATAALSKGVSNLIAGERFEKNMAAASFGAVAVQMIAQGLINERAIRAGIRSDAAKEGKILTSSQENALYMAEVQRIAELSKICAASLGVITGLDVSSIVSGASTVLEQDFMANHKRQAAEWQMLQEKGREKPQIKVTSKEETKEKVISKKSRSRKAAPSRGSKNKALSAAEEEAALDMTVKLILGPSPQQIFEQKLFELVTEMVLEEKQDKKKNPQASKPLMITTMAPGSEFIYPVPEDRSFKEVKKSVQHLWNLFYEDSKEYLRVRANESREYFHAQANRDYLQELACLPIPGSGMAAFAYEGRNIYRGTQTFGAAVVDITVAIIGGKLFIAAGKKVIAGGQYVWQKGKDFVQPNMTNTLSAFVRNEQGAGKNVLSDALVPGPTAWKELNRDIYKEDLGKNIGGVKAFSARLSMKSSDVAHMFVRGIEGKEIKLRNVMNNLENIGKETGAKVLEIESMITNTKLKNYLIKYYHLTPGDHNWDKLPLSFELITNIKNWDKITIPLTSPKVPQPLNLKGEAKATAKISSFIRDEQGAGKDLVSGVLVLGKKAMEGGKYVWQKGKAFVTAPRKGYSKNPMPLKYPNGVIWEKDLGNNIGGVEYFTAKLSMKSKDIVNIHVEYITGKGIKPRNIMDNLVNIAKETGAKVLEIESMVRNTKLKNHLIKRYNLIPGDRNWDKLSSEDRFWLAVRHENIKNWDKITIPLSSGKLLPASRSTVHEKAVSLSTFLPSSAIVKPERLEKMAAANKSRMGLPVKNGSVRFRGGPPKKPANPLFTTKPSTENIMGVEAEKRFFSYFSRPLTLQDLGLGENSGAVAKGLFSQINNEVTVRIDYLTNVGYGLSITNVMKNLMKTAQEKGVKTLTIQGGIVDKQFKKYVRQNHTLAPGEHWFEKNKITISVNG